MNEDFLKASIKRFEYYRLLGDSAIAQLDDDQLHWQMDADLNSVAVTMQHMAGNMRSRWTNFLTSDGEKTWRKRDQEFEEQNYNRGELEGVWEMGWDVLMNTLKSLKAEDVERTIYIRAEAHSVIDAVLRQLAHYGYHVGQIVQLGKFLKGKDWQPLSIPKGGSDAVNEGMFGKETNE